LWWKLEDFMIVRKVFSHEGVREGRMNEEISCTLLSPTCRALVKDKEAEA